MAERIDEEFLRCCLEELRDGEAVTIQTGVPFGRIRNALARLGATDEEIDRVQFVPFGSSSPK